MATVTSQVTPELRTLTAMIRRMFPHEGFPDGPYTRSAQAVQAAAGEDPRTAAQLQQGLAELAARGFDDLDDAAALALLKDMSGTTFFQTVRAKVITTFYDDREVWALLGYEVDSFAQGGYVDRGFADLDWLPAARIEGPTA